MAFLLSAAADLLTKSQEQGRLAHAYLITGPRGSGKTELALQLVGMVNEVQPETLDSAAGEYCQIVRPESKSRRIRVEGMRALEKRLHLAAPKRVTKVGIVLEADRLMPEAANAFLKTLEEPPPQSLLLLLSSEPEQLLDTILSRCIKVPLHRSGAPEYTASETKLLEALAAHYGRDQPGGVASAWSFMQSFTAILKEEKSVIKKQHDEAMKGESAAYQKTTEGDYLKRREEFYKALTESEYLQRRNNFVQILVNWFGDALRQQGGFTSVDLIPFQEETGKVAEKLDEKDLVRRLDALEDLRTNLNTNVHETLALEVGFLGAFG